jgi:hypothetical protein
MQIKEGKILLNIFCMGTSVATLAIANTLTPERKNQY